MELEFVAVVLARFVSSGTAAVLAQVCSSWRSVFLNKRRIIRPSDVCSPALCHWWFARPRWSVQERLEQAIARVEAYACAHGCVDIIKACVSITHTKHLELRACVDIATRRGQIVILDWLMENQPRARKYVGLIVRTVDANTWNVLTWVVTKPASMFRSVTRVDLDWRRLAEFCTRGQDASCSQRGDLRDSSIRHWVQQKNRMIQWGMCSCLCTSLP